ncbi:hypothetical protein DIS18_07615 [Algibacter marinivivus]|uniref:Glycerophosphoryl diester phosphodiesterase membrane domain-containing protein n=1 Tax=Algibacter marinivivus TaxID=2100723 RepID=A0A2U2X9E4_9FLAO|nr:hypothetical protein [Algibacter marinivivus]PWH84392.1 hypothetical protein DIS18_07615 [Algibacter marinivivus]
MNTFESLVKKIENAKDLEFSNLFDSVIELFKKVWLKGFLTVLLIAIVAFCANILFSLLGLASNQTLLYDGFDLEFFFKSYSETIIYNIPQAIIVSTMTMAFVAAFYRICRQHVLGEDAVDDYFYFLKKGYFSKLLMLGLIHTGISVLAQFLFILPAIYVFVPLAYFTIIFANNPNLSESEIVKASFRLGNKKWLITFGTMFVAGLLGMLGIIGCGIGLLFTISIVYLPVFFIYKEVVGFEDTSEIEQIGVRDDSDY